mmetsp:Transcript_9336/g.19983  ORF Transcript_9336/g.19983 Transcript_9336/m.19983 type:complete len:114 (+) Transcript_9336:155-496(+)
MSAPAAATTATTGKATGEAEDSAAASKKPEDKTCCQYFYLGLLDFMASIFRLLVAVGSGLKWCFKYTFYPVKECFFEIYDCIDKCWHPYKRKKPLHGVAGFRYDGFYYQSTDV